MAATTFRSALPDVLLEGAQPELRGAALGFLGLEIEPAKRNSILLHTPDRFERLVTATVQPDASNGLRYRLDSITRKGCAASIARSIASAPPRALGHRLS